MIQVYQKVRYGACPRCHGDLFLDQEEADETPLYTCLQCGRSTPAESVLPCREADVRQEVANAA